MFQDKLIDDDQRDQLKDLVFDDDVTLLGIFERAESNNVNNQELMNNVLKYIQAGSFEYNRPASLNANTTASDNTDELDAQSSPADAAINMKKRRRMKQIQEEAAKAKEQQQPKTMDLNNCDIGASPTIKPSGGLMKKAAGYQSPLLAAQRNF
eukprot:CAMPEP_0176355638 /NCGR_PEP_ID=MMETSP0126-20121128/13430_1 /TAXON_ID=141414 ORGANISM="Strombidinopsis acuminatum, Strain SPMC142" /NCGR_SAMPLE_ID=MMETSP0126 /ASSEMBLY_ACC=CAM_ASM_000229 /LENGTH=152 /DNA_ID=CAMNT_0017708359 /DNA_START=87 /DNA_END=545 /DNA_ORIENTATION=-